ncbi:MAG: hypothetical protein ABIH42_00965 [Planctomycetota bacterium]
MKITNTLTLFWGKLRRFYYHTVRPGYVRDNIGRREGECQRCGACCRLAHLCYYLEFDDKGLAMCKAYRRRAQNCRVFPIDERDINDRNLILPNVSCGYHFKKNIDD